MRSKKKGELVAAENRIESDTEKKGNQTQGGKKQNEMTRGMRTRTAHN